MDVAVGEERCGAAYVMHGVWPCVEIQRQGPPEMACGMGFGLVLEYSARGRQKWDGVWHGVWPCVRIQRQGPPEVGWRVAWGLALC